MMRGEAMRGGYVCPLKEKFQRYISWLEYVYDFELVK